MQIRRFVPVALTALLFGGAISPVAWGNPTGVPARMAAAVPSAVVPTPSVLSVSPTPTGMVVGVRAALGSTVTAQALSGATVVGTSSPTAVDSAGDAFLTISGLAAGSYTVKVTATVGAVTSAPATGGPVATGGGFGAGDFVPVGPIRAYDSRTDPAGPLLAQNTRAIPLRGHAGIPTLGVDAVAIAVSAVGPTTAGYLTVWPNTSYQPVATSLNFSAWQTKTNLVKVPLGADGAVGVFNFAGSVHVTVDVVGFYIDSSGTFTHNQSFQSVSPIRAYDSRPAFGGTGPIPAGGTVDVAVATAATGVPANATAVEIQVEAIDPTAEGYLTVWAKGGTQPVVSNVLYLRSTTVTSAIAPIGADGKISVFSNVSTGFAVDICGYYSPGATGRFHALTPNRIYDSRATNQRRLLDAETRALQFTSVGLNNFSPSVPGDATSAVFSATAVNNTAATFLTFWPVNLARPTAAMILPSGPNQLNDNLVVTWLGVGGPANLASGAIAAYNHVGRTHLVLDISGYYTDELPPTTSTATGVIGRVKSTVSGSLFGLPGARVLIYKQPNTSTPDFSVITDPSGLFNVPLPPGGWVACVDATYVMTYGFVGQCWQGATWPTAENNTANTWLWVGSQQLLAANFSPPEGILLEGTITYGTAPLDSAYVAGFDLATFSAYNDAYSATDGTFRVPGLPGYTDMALCALPYPWNPSLYPWKCYPYVLNSIPGQGIGSISFDYRTALASATAALESSLNEKAVARADTAAR